MKNKNQQQAEELQPAIKNTSEQLNPNNDKFWQSRGFEKRPENWKELSKNEKQEK
ncbi:MAG TPA: hypothetical protein VLZ72_06360 [Flavobacterium sp.]|nr:hypothetical protein [Flavobacterium sp.]